MSEQESIKLEEKIQKKSFGKKILKGILYLFLILAFFSISLIILAQFRFFRNFALENILKIVNKELIAKIEIDDLTFSHLAGIQLYGVRLITDNDTLANVPELIIDANLYDLLNQKVSINSIILKNPDIRLLRNTVDSLWNYDKIASSSDTSSSEPSPWKIDVKKLELRNAKFLMYDSTISYINYSMLDYDHLSIYNLDLKLSAKINLQSNDFLAKIYKLNCNEKYSRLRIQNLSSTLILNPKVIAAKDFRAKLNESDFDINIEMTNFDVFETYSKPEIEKAHFNLSAKGFNVEDSVIQKFEYIPIEFGKSSNIYIDAIGTLSDLTVKRLRLETGNSDIRISGKLKNLLNIDDFEYEFSLDNSKFLRKDIIDMLANLDLNGIPKFDNAYAKRLYVRGFLDSVYTDLDINTKIGDLVGKAGINYSKDIMTYFADCNVKNLYLSPITNNNDLSGILNGRVYLKGEGTDFKDINASLISNLYNSQILGINISNFRTNLNVNEKRIQIDTLFVELTQFKDNSDIELFEIKNENQSYIDINGILDLYNEKSPNYDLAIKLNSINFNSLFKDNSLPSNITSDISVNASGFDIDSLNGKFYAQIHALDFADRGFFPFSININIERENDDFRNLVVNSEFMNFEINGNYHFLDIINGISLQGTHIAEYISDKIESYNPKKLLTQDTVSKQQFISKIGEFPDINANISVNIKDISMINLFLDSMSIYSSINLKAKINSSKNQSSILVDTLELKDFSYQADDITIKTAEIKLQSNVITSIKDSIANIDLLKINFDNSKTISLNDIKLDSAYTNLSFDGDNLNYIISSYINNDMNLALNGKLEIGETYVKLNADSLKFSLNNKYLWKNTNTIKIKSTLNGFAIEDFSIQRDSAETIFLRGAIDDDKAKNIVFDISNLPVTDFLPLAGDDIVKEFEGMVFNVDSLRIRINGDLKTPRIVSSIYADSLIISNYKIGNISGRLIHNESYVNGYFDVVTPLLGNKKTLVIDVNYLPIYLGVNSEIPLMDTSKALDIRLKATQLPLELLMPFATGLSELSGYADANIIVEGSLQDGITYSGKAISTKTRLKIENTNIEYNAELNVDFNKDKVTLSKVILKNIPEDNRFGRLGKAELTGTIELNGFEIGNLDLYATTDRLLVMSDATMVTMPDLYGDFIISTENAPLRFYGTLQKPNLDANVIINYAHLKMPLETKKSMVRTYLTYRKMGDTVRIQSITSTDSTNFDNENNDKNEGISPSIADLINYNLQAKILGQFIVEMDMDLIGSMYAVIATSDKSRSLRYEKNRDEEEGKLFGEVVVKEQSTIKSWKQFTTSGVINFPTGSIENPLLDLSATHTGTMMEDGVRKQFIVKMFITGFKENPKVSFKYYIDQVEGTGSQEQINEDALYLLTLGRTKSNTIGNLNNSILNEGFASGVSNFATKALSDLLIGTGVIQSAEFDFQGGSMNLGDATLRLTGQLYGGISWTIGGTVADLSSNNQITIDIPAAEFSDNPFWSNFILQFSKASNTNVLANTQDAKNWEIKIKLGSSW